MTPLERFMLGKFRSRIIPLARGKVLEVGAGTGANISYYRWDTIEEICFTDREVDASFNRFWQRRLRQLGQNKWGQSLLEQNHRQTSSVQLRDKSEKPLVFIVSADAQSLPFPPESFDSVVSTLVFCSLEDPLKGAKEVWRVLRPGGRFLFVEHVRPEDPFGSTLADRCTPFWRRIASGCHLNRDTLATFRDAGFTFQQQVYQKGVFLGGVLIKSLSATPTKES
ncbi:MAG: methyltransferase domain-containing protein [Spirochaetales bacterium]